MELTLKIYMICRACVKKKKVLLLLVLDFDLNLSSFFSKKFIINSY